MAIAIKFLGETPARNACEAFRAIGIGFLMFVRSFDTKSAPRISRKPFNPETPHFKGTSIPTLSTATLDRTSLSASGRNLYGQNSRKIPHPTASGAISRERFHEILRAYRGQTAAQTGQKWRHYLLPVGCKMLFNTKCRKRLTRKWCEMRQKISVLQRQRRFQISRVKNIGRVFELSVVAFRLIPSYGGLLVKRNANAFSLNAIVDARLRRRRVCRRHEMILGKRPKAFCPYVMTSVRRRRRCRC